MLTSEANRIILNDLYQYMRSNVDRKCKNSKQIKILCEFEINFSTNKGSTEQEKSVETAIRENHINACDTIAVLRKAC
jgi:hypothetical protein